MSFLIAGDTHGTLDLAKVVQYYEGRNAEFSKDEDYLIILGDVGVCGLQEPHFGTFLLQHCLLTETMKILNT